MHSNSFGTMQTYDQPPPPAPGPPVQKALVIGINYAEKGKEGGALCGGQRDALAWKDLLISKSDDVASPFAFAACSSNPIVSQAHTGIAKPTLSS